MTEMSTPKPADKKSKPVAKPPAATKPAAKKPVAAVPKPPTPKPLRKPARPAKMRFRHLSLILMFLIMVGLPTAFAAWYLNTRAADQYASTLGFTVRSEDVSSAIDIFSGLSSSFGSTGSHDSDILYEFIRNQRLVRVIDEKLDLKALYSRHFDTDPLLSYDPSGTIEDLTNYWQRMVRVSYDTGSGLIELRVLAFDPHEAQIIAQEIYNISSDMINELSGIAREDTTRYAREDLELAAQRLKTTRENITAFRLQNQILDPAADIQMQTGLLSTLQTQQAEALIEFDVLASSTREGDPRLEQARQRITIIEERILQERQKFGANGQAPGGDTFAAVVAAFEGLMVERELAENAYAAAQAGFEAARAEANRQSRYLAAYVAPTLAEKAEFPQRGLIIGVVALFSLLIWTMSSLIYYALRDRG